MEKGLCGFLVAWGGACEVGNPCSLHMEKRCWLCDAPAVRECAWAGSLVCGVPECGEHSHYEEHYRK